MRHVVYVMMDLMRRSAIIAVIVLTVGACAAPAVPVDVSPTAAITVAPSPTPGRTVRIIPPLPTPVPTIPMDDPVFAAMFETAVARHPGHRFQLVPDRLEGEWRLAGNASDGSGAGRLFLAVTTDPGQLSAHPCADQDFNHGGPCDERPLPNGDLLVVRGVAEDDLIRVIAVVLIHPDRSGISAEATNLRLPMTIVQHAFSAAGEHQAVPPTRLDPILDLDELSALVLAIDERLQSR